MDLVPPVLLSHGEVGCVRENDRLVGGGEQPKIGRAGVKLDVEYYGRVALVIAACQ